MKSKTMTQNLSRLFASKWLAVALLVMTAGYTGIACKGQTYDTAKTYLVIKNDGTEYAGKILKSDEREILIETKAIGKIYIPKHEIKSISEINPADVKGKDYVGDEPFSTRHILTTNGHSLGKGTSYANITLWGPDVEFGITEKFSLGIMTTWLAAPLVGSAKYSVKLHDRVHFGAGALVGTASWVRLNAWGALPYGVITLGGRKSNISLSGGAVFLGSDGEVTSQPLFNVAGMSRISKKVSFIFDSFLVPSNGEINGVVVPALRFHGNQQKAFQFGFGAVVANSKLVPLPIPVLSWLRAF
ncbi:MAG: hypothetical protein JNL57_12370 [Bacteroidetes bacterium]|nr:hypothetical protein [Bacteroidota bacterium]